MRYLDKILISYFNKRTIKAHGGNFIPPNNFLHEDALDYLIEDVDSKMFGVEIYPSLSDKAALYMFNIISNHIF